MALSVQLTCIIPRICCLVTRIKGNHENHIWLTFNLALLILQEHDVIESKPDNKVEDLRLHKPWPELQRSVLPSVFYFECGIDVGIDGNYLVFILSFCISCGHVLGRCVVYLSATT